MTLQELGLSVDDWVDYIRGAASDDVNRIIDEHFCEIEIPIITKKMKMEKLNINSLMLGDWVKHPKGQNRITQIQDNRVVFTDYSDDINGACDIDEIKPIPISSEILEKNGFQRFDFPEVKGQHKWSCQTKAMSWMSLWCRILDDNPCDGWMIEIFSPTSSICVKIDYIHELQHAIRLCHIDKEIKIG